MTFDAVRLPFAGFRGGFFKPTPVQGSCDRGAARRFFMSRSSRQRTGRSGTRHVRLYHWVLKTAAWKSLSAEARAIYIEMSARYHGTNNGQIPYSVREAANSLRIGKTTAARAIEMLQDRGFIVAMTKGAFSLKTRHATEWRLTEFLCDVSNALPTKEFARWSENQNAVPGAGLTVPVAVPNGTCSGTMEYREAA